MTIFARHMPQVATYWPPGVNDATGGLDFSDVEPVLISCRWQDDAELFRDNQGREFTSSAIVYPGVAVQVRGWLALGDATGSGGHPRGVSGAREIRQVAASPSLTGDETLIKAVL